MKEITHLDLQILAAKKRIHMKIDRRATAYLNKLKWPYLYRGFSEMERTFFAQRYGGYEIVVPPIYFFINDVSV